MMKNFLVKDKTQHWMCETNTMSMEYIATDLGTPFKE